MSPKRASSAAMTRSHCAINPMPAPRHNPLTAATIGFLTWRTRGIEIIELADEAEVVVRGYRFGRAGQVAAGAEVGADGAQQYAATGGVLVGGVHGVGDLVTAGSAAQPQGVHPLGAVKPDVGDSVVEAQGDVRIHVASREWTGRCQLGRSTHVGPSAVNVGRSWHERTTDNNGFGPAYRNRHDSDSFGDRADQS